MCILHVSMRMSKEQKINWSNIIFWRFSTQYTGSQAGRHPDRHMGVGFNTRNQRFLNGQNGFLIQHKI